jgi:hypothetical protein
MNLKDKFTLLAIQCNFEDKYFILTYIAKGYGLTFEKEFS